MTKIFVLSLIGAFSYVMFCEFHAANAYADAHREPVIIPGDWVAEITRTASLPRPVTLTRGRL